MEGQSERMHIPQWDGDPVVGESTGERSRFTTTGRTSTWDGHLERRLARHRTKSGHHHARLRTDHPTRTITTDLRDRIVERHRRGIDPRLARLEAELGQPPSQKKGESLEMLFATNKHQRRRCEINDR